MKRKTQFYILVGALLLVLSLAMIGHMAYLHLTDDRGLKDADFSGTIDPATVSLRPDDALSVSIGKKVYAENCASCHGVNLEGQPNWRQRGSDGLLPAPPHDPSGHTWHHPDGMLFALTKYGPGYVSGQPDYQSAMPAYDGVLKDAEIAAALSYIKSTWPDEIRARHDEINAQARR
jgi:mono/diheme cytochrome c family protein